MAQQVGIWFLTIQSINETGFSRNVNCRKLSGLNGVDVERLSPSRCQCTSTRDWIWLDDLRRA